MRVKICGLTSEQAVRDTAEAGADYLGFNFFPKSPRAISLDDAPRIIGAAPVGVMRVALVVDPDDRLLARIADLPIDMIQLHGKETPERVQEIREATGLPVMKVIGVRDADDVPAIDVYARVADQLMIDAKAPKGSVLPGGNGVQFDWRLIAGRRWPVPWMLAGGLTPENVAEGIRLTGTSQVDVASGVESAPGIKDPATVRRFVEASRTAAT